MGGMVWLAESRQNDRMVKRHRLQRLDLNLLLAFDVLIEECNVTRAAERLNVGQPAMSASLAKLRKILDDPLLVREGRQLRPTPVALELVSSVREGLDLIGGAVDSRQSFDPATGRRTFTIMASDYVLVLFLAWQRPRSPSDCSSSPAVAIRSANVAPFRVEVHPGKWTVVTRPSRSRSVTWVCCTDR